MEYHHNNIFVASKIVILYISRGTQEWIAGLDQIQKIKKEYENQNLRLKCYKAF